MFTFWVILSFWRYRNRSFLVALYRLIVHKTLPRVVNLDALPLPTKIGRVALKTRGNSRKWVHKAISDVVDIQMVHGFICYRKRVFSEDHKNHLKERCIIHSLITAKKFANNFITYCNSMINEYEIKNSQTRSF